MADGILYLDVDDEITSAAGRVRSQPTGRVALVLPYGSRVATSRINFRLLARDALTHEKRLSIVATDAATRALAASAGLPVFASVAEYESSLVPGTPAAGPTDPADPDATRATAATETASRRRRKAAAAGAAAAGVAAPGAAAVTTGAGAGDAGAAGGSEAGAVTASDIDATAAIASTPEAIGSETARVDTPVPTPTGGPPPPPPQGPGRTGSRGGRRGPIAIGLAVLALALVVGAVGAYVFLPSASIVVTPRSKAIGPISLTVTADPTTTEPDPTAGTVPAQILSVEVATSDTFPATGKRVEETAATGSVRFRNVDFTSANTIPAGSVVSASGGIRFRTNRSVTVPAAELRGLQIFPSFANVEVTAVKAGPEGNLEPNTILTIPKDESPVTLSVTNPEATSGGTREEFPKVTQADVDGALASLDASLQTEFEAQIVDPSIAPSGSTVFPETATLGPTTPTVDPATLVDTEAESFELGLSATGTVVAVDDAPVADIAETRLRANVSSGSELVEGSITVDVGPAVVVGDQVSFPVSVSATEVAILDPDALKELVLGKTPAEATAILEPYGASEITLSPDWVTTIPTIESRVDLTIAGGQDGDGGDSPSPDGPSPSP